MAKKTKKSKEEYDPDAPVVIAKNAPTTIYIGKTVYGLSYGTIFKGGVLPPHVADLAKKDAIIKGLIVPVTELQTARQNMRVKGHILNAYANKQK